MLSRDEAKALLVRVHPEMPDGHSEVSRSEMRDFAQDQRNRGPKAERLGTEHPKRCEETGDPKRSDWGLSTRSGAKKPGTQSEAIGD
jgi:hypothetical protein